MLGYWDVPAVNAKKLLEENRACEASAWLIESKGGDAGRWAVV